MIAIGISCVAALAIWIGIARRAPGGAKRRHITGAGWGFSVLCLGLIVAGGPGGTSVPAAKADSGMHLTASDYGEDWPFTVASVDLQCTRLEGGADPHVTVLTPNQMQYALNGAAMGSGQYGKLAAIRKANPEYPSSKAAIPSGMIQTALDNCTTR